MKRIAEFKRGQPVLVRAIVLAQAIDGEVSVHIVGKKLITPYPLDVFPDPANGRELADGERFALVESDEVTSKDGISSAPDTVSREVYDVLKSRVAFLQEENIRVAGYEHENEQLRQRVDQLIEEIDSQTLDHRQEKKALIGQARRNILEAAKMAVREWHANGHLLTGYDPRIFERDVSTQEEAQIRDLISYLLPSRQLPSGVEHG